MEYAFNVFNRYAADGTAMSVRQFLQRFQNPEFQKNKHTSTSLSTNSAPDFPIFNAPPVVLCIGSDLAIGDSL